MWTNVFYEAIDEREERETADALFLSHMFKRLKTAAKLAGTTTA